MHRAWPRRVVIGVVVAYLAVVILSFFATWRVQQLSARNQAAIQQITANRKATIARFKKTDVEICVASLRALHDLLAASDASLGHPGTPAYSYYRSHPDELLAAHRADRGYLRMTDPARCAHLPSATNH